MMGNLSKYNVLVLEDTHMVKDNPSYKLPIENFVSIGNIIFFTEHTDKDGEVLFNATEDDTCGAGTDKIATVIDTDDGLNLNIGDNISMKDTPCMKGYIKTIAQYSNGGPAISTWEFGNGELYYFSDFMETLNMSSCTYNVLFVMRRILSDLITDSEP